MKKKFILILTAAFSLISCSNEEDLYGSDLDSNLDSDKSLIIEDIGELAEETFSKGKQIIDEIELPDFTKPKVNKKMRKSDDKKKIRKNIKPLIDEDPKAKWVYDNFYEINNTQAYLTGNDPDTIDFVYNLNNGPLDFDYFEGESKELGRDTPYYLQWDNRWAYDSLGMSNIGIAGCGPTSMAMVLARLTGDMSITPKVIAEDARGYMVEEGIAWAFFKDEAHKYNFTSKSIEKNKDAIINALADGPLIVSVNKGYFTLFGHIFVIDSYVDGKFIINDPNSIKNSENTWTYEDIEDQIAHIWKIS